MEAEGSRPSRGSWLLSDTGQSRLRVMDGLVVRRMEPEELAAVIEVWYRSLDDSLHWLRPDQRASEAEARARFRNVVAKSCDLWVAEQDGRILGVLAMDGDAVDRLYVDTPAQGKGVGSALLDRAKVLSPETLRLATLQRNEQARRFYEGRGFVAYNHGRSPAPENEPTVWYRWRGDPTD